MFRDETPFAIRPVSGGRALFATVPIAPGTRLSGEDDWADADEQAAYVTLSPAELDALPPERRVLFRRYAYNTSPETITGTFHAEAVRHPTSFANHSCDPNAGYDGGRIVALRAIAAGEQITMDYGTFSFSFDHDFVCGCGTPACRGAVRRDDWRKLVRAGLKLPGFMAERAESVLRG